MTTFPSNQNRDWTATQAAPRRTPSPDAPTMAAYFPPATARQASGPAYGQPQLAWSAEQPEFNPESYGCVGLEPRLCAQPLDSGEIRLLRIVLTG